MRGNNKYNKGHAPCKTERDLFFPLIIIRHSQKLLYNLLLKKRKEIFLVPLSVPSTMAGRGRKALQISQMKKHRRFPPVAFNSPQSLKSEQPLRYAYRRYPKAVAVRPPPPVVVPARPPIMQEASPSPSPSRHAKQEASPPPQLPPPIKHVKKEASPPKRLSPGKKMPAASNLSMR